MSLKDLGKKFKDFGGKIRDTFTKGIGGKLAFLSLLLLIPKILNSETFIKVLRYLVLIRNYSKSNESCDN